jgi:hypothetical protein
MTPAVKKQLGVSLDAVRRILGHAGIYGGREVMTARELERRITRLLEPEDASALCAEANAFAAVNLPFIDKGRVSAERVEVERAAEEARVKAIRDNHHAKQAAAVRERAEREQRAIAAAAVSEIL